MKYYIRNQSLESHYVFYSAQSRNADERQLTEPKQQLLKKTGKGKVYIYSPIFQHKYKKYRSHCEINTLKYFTHSYILYVPFLLYLSS